MTQVRAGPTAARQLADWGADVIQVQMPEHMRGDDTLGGQDGSDYQYTHRNKRSMTLNLKEPQVQHLGILKKVTSKHLGEQILMGQPVTLARTPSTIARAAPRRGEHSEEILSELGYDGAALARMKSAGVF